METVDLTISKLMDYNQKELKLRKPQNTSLFMNLLEAIVSINYQEALIALALNDSVVIKQASRLKTNSALLSPKCNLCRGEHHVGKCPSSEKEIK